MELRLGKPPTTFEAAFEQLRPVQQIKHRLLARDPVDTSPVRPVVLRSWQRSMALGVEPRLGCAPTVLGGGSLDQAREENHLLLSAAGPLLAELEVLTSGSGQVITLCDSASRVLAVRGDREGLRATEQINLSPGADWSEGGAGTNAMGMALVEEHPVMVLATEHYCASWEHWSCAAAPIRGGTAGRVIGVLDISGPYTILNKHALAAVTASARAIEGRMFQEELAVQHRLFSAYADALGLPGAGAVLAFDASGHLVRATQSSQALLEGLPPAPNPALARVLADALASARPQSDWVRGRDLLYEVVCSPVLDRGAVRGAVVTARPGRVRPPAPAPAPGLPGVVGSHPAMLRVLEQARRAAPADATVLLTGETGTGKDVLARAIHQAGRRSGGPFVAVNCGALTPALAASELFGYMAGAFTGAAPRGSAGKVEAANGGTLFLDEVGELPPEVQVMLLRMLQDREIMRVGSQHTTRVDVRVIAATNRDLEAQVAQGRFRADLFYRLNVVHLGLPPLRERLEDIPALVRQALLQFGAPDLEVPPDAMALLQAHSWPGNVRELFNLVERAVVLGEDLADVLPGSQVGHGPQPGHSERDAILNALSATGGNAAAAARRLGLGRSTFYRRLRGLGISVERQAH